MYQWILECPLAKELGQVKECCVVIESRFEVVWRFWECPVERAVMSQGQSGGDPGWVHFEELAEQSVLAVPRPTGPELYVG